MPEQRMTLCCAPACWARNAWIYGGVPLCPAHFAAVAARVPPPPPSGPQHLVYYVSRIDRPGQIKIGTTRQLKKRLQALGARGRTPTLLATEPGDSILEHQRHAQFAETRLDGEWFELTDPLRIHLHTLGASVM